MKTLIFSLKTMQHAIMQFPHAQLFAKGEYVMIKEGIYGGGGVVETD